MKTADSSALDLVQAVAGHLPAARFERCSLQVPLRLAFMADICVPRRNAYYVSHWAPMRPHLRLKLDFHPVLRAGRRLRCRNGTPTFGFRQLLFFEVLNDERFTFAGGLGPVLPVHHLVQLVEGDPSKRKIIESNQSGVTCRTIGCAWNAPEK